MPEELKIRIHNYKEVEAKLTSLGARFIKELTVKDTYFSQPTGEVLKITEDDEDNFLVNLKSENGKFRIIRYDSISEPETTKQELTQKLGIKCVLKKKRRFFDFEGLAININLIESVGEFLIVEGEHLTTQVITDKLKIENPEFVTLSFDELKK